MVAVDGASDQTNHVPSGLERATYSVAMLLLAPGLFSTMILRLLTARSFSPGNGRKYWRHCPAEPAHEMDILARIFLGERRGHAQMVHVSAKAPAERNKSLRVISIVILPRQARWIAVRQNARRYAEACHI